MSQNTSHVWKIYAAQVSVSLSTPKTVIQYAAAAAVPAQILGLSLTQSNSVTSAMERVRLGRVTVAATGLTAGSVGSNIFRWGSPDDGFKGQLGTALTGTGVGVTPVEPTYGDLPEELDFNVLNGYREWFPRPIFVPAAGIIGVRVLGVTAGTWDVGLYVEELYT